MPPSHLPFEVIVKILNHLVRLSVISNSRNPHLLACSLVSCAWLGAMREHMWDSEWFRVPRTERHLTALKLLCASPSCSLRLDKVVDIYADPWNPLTTPFFEWCPAFFTGLNRIDVRVQIVALRHTTLQNGIFAGLLALKSLLMYDIHFASINDFYDLLLSVKGLEYLKCRRVYLDDEEMEEPDKLLMKSSIRTLDIDFDSFSALFYRRVALTGLQELEFEQPFFRNIPQNYSDDRRWEDIGDMLAYAGRRLVKLKLHLVGKIGFCESLMHIGRVAILIPDSFHQQVVYKPPSIYL
ncbi:hypothetical protein Moror_4298 [Moniliophthora roreri MCA 2997]|uniref:Uncharacterized protein n=1 Tax=Moniliophthora roreri (strain MCA 2997) TaxID=1381753 RepID=V2X9W7_MONRO|nr:hypothetical protein Moror_4298 [Moniliophthora roreri MCA 2997]